MVTLEQGKLNLLIDGQFGSTGKGLFSQYIGVTNHIDIAISNASSNAGHTFYHTFSWEPVCQEPRKIIVKHLPVSGVVNKRCTIYLCAGSIIDPDILLKEIEETGTEDRVFIHPRAAVIEPSDITHEHENNGVKKIASTMSGVGSALVRKIDRNSTLAEHNEKLKPFVRQINVQEYLGYGCTAFMEVPQGMDLSLNHGYAYPYCTSRDITPAAAMNDACVHPKYLGKVSVCLRTFPIRVGNVVEKGKEVGYSGPFYDDSIETSWRVLRIKRECTTRTNRIRRVATFSYKQYDKMIQVMQPDYVFLNFCNYLGRYRIERMIKRLPEITHLGFGPTVEDIKKVYR